MLNRAVKRTTLAGAFVLTGLFSAGFTYRVLALKAEAAREPPCPPQRSYAMVDNPDGATSRDGAIPRDGAAPPDAMARTGEKCRPAVSIEPL